jgi:hypothetical protein
LAAWPNDRFKTDSIYFFPSGLVRKFLELNLIAFEIQMVAGHDGFVIFSEAPGESDKTVM